MSENMRIWDKVSKTDPANTKYDTFNKQTTVNPQSRLRAATELWGPIGLGWGYTIIEERFDNGAAIFSKEGEIDGYELTHTVVLEVWYKDGDTVVTVPHSVGHTPYLYMTSSGDAFTDKEYYKKTITDALGKSLSLLGFNADIYAGLYDDEGYKQETLEEFEIARAEDKAAKEKEFKEKYIAEINKNLELIKNATTVSEANGIYKQAIIRATRKGDKATIERFVKATDAKVKQLQKKENQK